MVRLKESVTDFLTMACVSALDILKADNSFARHECSLKSLQIIFFPWL